MTPQLQVFVGSCFLTDVFLNSKVCLETQFPRTKHLRYLKEHLFASLRAQQTSYIFITPCLKWLISKVERELNYVALSTYQPVRTSDPVNL